MEELNKKIQELSNQLIKSTQEVVKIKSVQEDKQENMPYGEGVNKCLNYALDLSQSLGFKTVNMDGYLGYAEYGEGEDYVGVLGHLDVVPEGDGWKYPPYSGEIHEGKIYGRGTTDDKGPIMAALYGLKAIKDLNLPLSKRVRIIFGTNEETGSKEMEYYNEREKPPVLGFTPDGYYPIIYAEKGMTMFDIVKDFKNHSVIKYIKGGQRPNMVPDYTEARLAVNFNEAEKVLSEFKKEYDFNISLEEKDEDVLVKSIGFSAHGSTPELGKNAIMQLFKFLEVLVKEDSDAIGFVKFCNKHIGFETDGKSFNCYLEDEASGKLSFNAGVINMGENKVTLGLNLRYPVTHTYEDMMNGFDKTIEGSGIRVTNMLAQKPLYFEENHPLIKTLQKVYKEETGDEPKLLAIGGGTYAKEMANIVAFGPIFPGQPDLDHQSNEYISTDDLIKNAKIYGRAIYELAK